MNRTIALLAFLLIMQTAFAEEYVYLRTVGDVQSKCASVLDCDSSGKMTVCATVSDSKEAHRMLLAEDYSTLEWRCSYADGQVATFKREGNTVVSEGHLPDKKAVTEAKIDGAPWYASIDLGMGEFVRAGEKSLDFWTVNPENGKAYKMTAKRTGHEEVSCDGLSVTAVRVRVSVSGLPAAFFSNSYWYRENDGLFVRFEGTMGGPGSQKVTLELAKEYLE